MGSGKSSALIFPLLRELLGQTPYGNDVSAGSIIPAQYRGNGGIKDKLCPQSHKVLVQGLESKGQPPLSRSQVSMGGSGCCLE